MHLIFYLYFIDRGVWNTFLFFVLTLSQLVIIFNNDFHDNRDSWNWEILLKYPLW